MVDCSTSYEVWTTLANQFGARVQEAVWLKRFIEDLKIVIDSSRPVIINCNS